MAEILSQEEIDALLGAVEKGDVDIGAEPAAAPEARRYDLTSQGKMMRDEFFALEEVYYKFASLLRTTLSSTLQRSMEINFVSSENVKFGEHIQAFSNPSSYNVFSMDPLIGSALMTIEAGLVFSLIDCMFGGEGRPLPTLREFTNIENRMMSKFAETVFKNFESAWDIVHPVSVNLKKTENKSEFIHIVNPNEMVIATTYSITGAAFSGNIYICITHLMLEPIKEKLSSKYLMQKDMDYAWKEQLQPLIRDVEVSLNAELGRTRWTVRDLLNLKINDIIKLPSGPDDNITINIENVPKFKGTPGVVKGNRAVEIATLISRNGGRTTNGQGKS